MAYFTVTDFKYGMDRRRKRVAGIPGTLWLGKNVDITRGGDIDRAKKFVSAYTLPASTFGLGQVRGQLYVFGSASAPTMPSGVQYQRLQSSTSSAMTEVLDVDTFDGKLYVVARYADGHVQHFYNGSRVTAWDTVADAATNMATLVAYMADLLATDSAVDVVAAGTQITFTAKTAGVDFTLAKSTTDGGSNNDQDITLATVTANVAEVDETQATGTVTITGGTFSAGLNTVLDVTVDGTSLLYRAVDWVSSNSATASAVATQINNKTSVHGYTAVAVGAVVTITAAPGTGATPNGAVVATSLRGNVTASTDDMSGGVAAVSPVAKVMTATFSGTFQAADSFTVTLNGVAYTATGRAAGTGTSAFVYKRRAWSPANSLWNYCKLNDPTDWTDTNVSSGAGFLNVGNESNGSERLIGAAPYGTQAAVFSRNNIQVYSLSTDAEENQVAQPVSNTGSVAARAILAYGNTDVFYLDEPGIRSLKAHDQTGEAYAFGVGALIDSFVRDHMDTIGDGVAAKAVATVGPEGRFWLALGDRVYSLSNFPESKITAWTFYEPGFTITDFVRVRNRIYARSGDTIYLYGGTDGATYPDDDEMIAEVQLPFMTAQTPATVKKLTGFDIACSGEWETHILLDPNDENKKVRVGKLTETTYNKPHITIPGQATHMALSLTCSKGGAATISSITVHYEPQEAR